MKIEKIKTLSWITVASLLAIMLAGILGIWGLWTNDVYVIGVGILAGIMGLGLAVISLRETRA